MPTDEALLERIAAHDEAAFDAFFARHDAAVRRKVLAMLRDPAATDDVVQEVFLRVWHRADDFEQRGSVAGWLGRIATNLALNHMRTVKRRRQQPLPAVRFQEDDEDGRVAGVDVTDHNAIAPDAIAAAAEQVDLLAGLVERLDPAKRDVWRLQQNEDLDIASIAEELGIPPGTVKSRLHHARRALAAAWEEIDPDTRKQT